MDRIDALGISDAVRKRVVECMMSPEKHVDFLADDFMYEEFFGVIHRKSQFLELYGSNGGIRLNECYSEGSSIAIHGDTLLTSWATTREFDFHGEPRREVFHSYLVFQHGANGWLWLGGQNMLRPKVRRSKSTQKSVPFPQANQVMVVLTDFSDPKAWNRVRKQISKPVGDFTADVQFVSDEKFKDATIEMLLSMVNEANNPGFFFVVDSETFRLSEHPVLVVDTSEDVGRTFRVVPSSIWNVENNLTIANMAFSDFADAVDEDGIFRMTKPQKTVRRKKVALEDLLRQGEDADFIQNTKLLNKPGPWTPQMIADAVAAIKRLAPTARLLVINALRACDGIAERHLEDLQRFVMAERDAELIESYLAFRSVFDLEGLFLAIVSEGMLENEDFAFWMTSHFNSGVFIEPATFSKLLATELDLKALDAVLRVFQSQCSRKNWLGDFSDQRLMILQALGNGELPVSVRKQMFFCLVPLQILRFPEETSKYQKVELSEKGLTSQFGSVESFMEPLAQTIDNKEISEERAFRVWLKEVARNTEAELKRTTSSRWPNVWAAIERPL